MMDENKEWVRQYSERQFQELMDVITALHTTIAYVYRYADTHAQKRHFMGVIRTLCERIGERARAGASILAPKQDDSDLPF